GLVGVYHLLPAFDVSGDKLSWDGEPCVGDDANRLRGPRARGLAGVLGENFCLDLLDRPREVVAGGEDQVVPRFDAEGLEVIDLYATLPARACQELVEPGLDAGRDGIGDAAEVLLLGDGDKELPLGQADRRLVEI